MRRVFTNASRNFVGSAFDNRVRNARNVLLAAPYFTDGARILAAVQAGRSVRLIVGLNSATSPFELEKLHHLPGLSIRFLTSRFHAKIFIFDDIAMVGSSNLTDGGMMSNREAVVCLDRAEDSDAIDEVKQLFRDLWESAAVLTDEKLAAFKSSWTMVRRKYGDADAEIEAAVGKNQPANISVDSRSPSRERIFLEDLRQLVYEQYRPAFSEVEGILVANHFRRPELAGAGLANETNRFLNWLRLTRVAGDDAWRDAPLRAPEQRRAIVIEAGQAWRDAEQSRVPDDYLDWLGRVDAAFGSAERIAGLSPEEIADGLTALHAFAEQLRFTKGGLSNLPTAFWTANGGDAARVRKTLAHLLYGDGDFIERLHDALYLPRYELGLFGRFCALELFGTVHPERCPPMNGRMAKALRFIGFDVPGG
ncbi:phospholipase D family protein [Sphingomonas sp. Leaf208]|uniref:phospholipase D family protein n=1 Tax=Sphingomonas sp. Leaf208 TaxID=1735679 RepID=UPI0006FDC171|nr:phospholipase D family protein [Sphingomonas sp. Leaf208]